MWNGIVSKASKRHSFITESYNKFVKIIDKILKRYTFSGNVFSLRCNYIKILILSNFPFTNSIQHLRDRIRKGETKEPTTFSRKKSRELAWERIFSSQQVNGSRLDRENLACFPPLSLSARRTGHIFSGHANLEKWNGRVRGTPFDLIGLNPIRLFFPGSEMKLPQRLERSERLYRRRYTRIANGQYNR